MEMNILRRRPLVPILGALLLLASCRGEELPPTSLGVASSYRVERLQQLRIVGGRERGNYRWHLVAANTTGEWQSFTDSVVWRGRDFVTAIPDTGSYRYECHYTDGPNRIVIPFRVHVQEEYTTYSPYVSDVLEYSPAPGPEVNRLIRATAQHSADEVLFLCKEAVCGVGQSSISLGGFGGHIVFAFDHLVRNVKGQPDFYIYSNVNQLSPSGEMPILTNGNPGIVEVAFDRNGNGCPDPDEWYELRGSEYDHDSTLADYEITYFRPSAEKAAEQVEALDQARNFDNPKYIAWTDNRGRRGYIPHVQVQGLFFSYWPLGKFKDADELHFKGRCLPPNCTEVVQEKMENGKMKTHVMPKRWAFRAGYADNLPKSLDQGFDIGDAVDAKGNPVLLPGIQFVRVYTAVNVQVGKVGVLATEISGAVDLHMKSK